MPDDESAVGCRPSSDSQRRRQDQDALGLHETRENDWEGLCATM